MLPDGSDGMGALARSRRLPPRGRRPRMPSRASGVLKTFAQRQEIGTAETARPLLGPRLPPCTWFHDSQSKSLFDAHVGADALVCPVERSSAALPVWQLACGVRLLISESPPPSGARCRSSFTTHWAARTLSAIRHSAATRTTASAVPISCSCGKVLSREQESCGADTPVRRF